MKAGMSIVDKYKTVRKTIPEKVKLIAVSKTKPAEMVRELYDAGHRVFGENKVQELCSKYEILPNDIEWHMIGHLQTNKVKYIAPFVHLIHSVDSIKLLAVINNEALKNNRVIDCLLQVKIAREDTKFGLSVPDLKKVLESEDFYGFGNVRIVGLMGMATFTDDVIQIRDEFGNLKKIFDDLRSDYFISTPSFKEISMGMSDDYKIAIEEGATMVRIGSIIFGQRVYN